MLGKSTWAVLGLTLDIELFTQAHYRASIDPDPELSALWKDVFLFHWKEESQHAILDELEWKREDARLTAAERDQAVNDLIDWWRLSTASSRRRPRPTPSTSCCRPVARSRRAAAGPIHATMLEAYRWQYIFSGVQDPRFLEVLGSMITPSRVRASMRRWRRSVRSPRTEVKP